VGGYYIRERAAGMGGTWASCSLQQHLAAAAMRPTPAASQQAGRCIISVTTPRVTRQARGRVAARMIACTRVAVRWLAAAS
jgi:hypothetical protein